jgi:large subunit ribosomal protein L10
MAKTRDQKKALVKEIAKVVGDAKSVVFVNFTKLQVKDETMLRRALLDSGSKYQVVKKTLLTKAIEGSGFEGTMAELPGMIGIATGQDLIAPAREVYNFQTTHKDFVSIVGGVFEGKFMSQSEMMAIATIPPMDVLRGMFANIINSPIQRFAIAMSEVAKTK